jgi:hypothetical protein
MWGIHNKFLLTLTGLSYNLFFSYLLNFLSMRTKSTLYCLAIAICLNITANAQADIQDSLALVDLYNSTNGPSWTNNTNWLTASPVSTWFGITTDGGTTGQRVRVINLKQNNLTGSIPSSIGTLKRLARLDLNKNQLTGSIPTSIGDLDKLALLDLHKNQLSGNIPTELSNLSSLAGLLLDHNQLSGNIPAGLGNITTLVTLRLQVNMLSGPIPAEIANHDFTTGSINLKRNNFTFDGMELLAQNSPTALYGRQAHIPTNLNGNTLSVSAGGTLSNNTYTWQKVTGTTIQVVATISGDSVFQPSETGTYFARITNSIATQLTLISDTVFYDATLPVTIIDFKGYAQKNMIEIDWTTVTEINLTRYEIQRSSNALEFSTVGSVPAKGSGTLRTNYTFNDVLPLHGNNFYRLKAVDADGKFSYSNIVLVNMNGDNIATTVYPNPAKDILHVQTTANTSFSLIDQSGKVLFSTKIDGIGIINVSNLSAGIYYLKNNSTGVTQKVVVVK